jgi:hypothetical protein
MYAFIIIYIAVIIYVITFRVVLDIITGSSEGTPVEITTAIVVFITILFAFNIFWIFKDKSENHENIIWLFALGFFIIFFSREMNIRYFHWSPIDVIGLVFILIAAHHIRKIDKYTGYLCIIAVLILVAGVGFDAILDDIILTDQTIRRALSILEESSELIAALFFLHTFLNLKFIVFKKNITDSK